jgi:hypothetical protein
MLSSHKGHLDYLVTKLVMLHKVLIKSDTCGTRFAKYRHFEQHEGERRAPALAEVTQRQETATE